LCLAFVNANLGLAREKFTTNKRRLVFSRDKILDSNMHTCVEKQFPESIEKVMLRFYNLPASIIREQIPPPIIKIDCQFTKPFL
jgi:hypothetical protein